MNSKIRATSQDMTRPMKLQRVNMNFRVQKCWLTPSDFVPRLLSKPT